MTTQQTPTDRRQMWRRVIRDLQSQGLNFDAHGNAARDPGAMRRRQAGQMVAENARRRRALDRATVDGRIGVVVDGMDCDCTQYHRGWVQPAWASVAAFRRWDEERMSWLDGPECMALVRPDQVDRDGNWSRDRALEAYEDGHPHVVRWGGRDD
jgi:hypothetical protein